MADFPVVITSAGVQPTAPSAILAKLLAAVAAVRPGYTANLPGSLVEDISSTDVGAVTEIDQARVELLNSLTPRGANAFLLAQLGQMFGLPLGVGSNTSVFLVFSAPLSPGFVIGKGFTVSDGSFQYVAQDGGIIGADGNSLPLFAVATQTGSWAVPPGSVTQLVSSVPSNVSLSVVNPEPGIPGNGSETEQSYRTRVIQAFLAATQGMPRYLRTLFGKVPGVQPRLIAALEQMGGGWEIVVGGGDPYQVAYVIYYALFDISTLVGSTLAITDITQASPGIVTTDLNHGKIIGDAITLASVDPMNYDGNYAVVSVPTQTTFGLGKPFAGSTLASISWASTGGGQATASTMASASGVTIGSEFTITGCTPAGYNGTFTALAGTTGNVIIYALASNPGAATTLGALLAGVANFDTSGLPAWISDGVVTPNSRNAVATITDWPDSYPIPFVVPPQQTVTMTVTWNTTSPNFVSAAAVAQLAGQPLVDYVNSIFVGQSMNLFVLQDTFQEAITSVLGPSLLTRMVFAVSIDGVGVTPEVGTGIIAGDPESFFFATLAGISIIQG